MQNYDDNGYDYDDEDDANDDECLLYYRNPQEIKTYISIHYIQVVPK